MGRTLASRAHPQRTVGLKRQSVPRAGKLRKRNTPVLPTAALDSTGKRRRAKPHRSEADLELARRMLEAMRCGADLRQRKVRRFRAAIKVRAYENDLKFKVAFERLRSAVDGW